MYSMYIDSKNKKVIRRYWNSAVLFTDAWNPNINEQEFTEVELLPGELSAVIFTVGCYIVRSVQRVYRIHKPGYESELETPASKEETELVRKYVGHENAGGLVGYYAITGMPLLSPPWGDNLRIVHEISVNHHANPTSQFAFICKAAHTRNWRWSESIRCICTAKKHIWISNECASLFVLNTYLGDSFCVDTWYEFDPAGKITVL